nr:Putative HTH-type transcriptional regulator [Paraburkholderia busanensis]
MKEEKTLAASAQRVTLFGRFALARDSRTLYADGQTLTLNERVMDVLIALLDAGGKIVSIEQLQQQLWPAASMVANSVQALVSQLRRALGDDRDLIETVPRRGYRLTAEWYDIRDDQSAPGGEQAASSSASDAPASTDTLSASHAATRDAGDAAAMRLPLIGRDAELSELLMRVPQHRLVTLVGARGVGKTRLAHEAAQRSAALFHDGAVFIGLAELTLPERVAPTIAAQLAPLGQAAGQAPGHTLAQPLIQPPGQPPVQSGTPGLDGLVARLAGTQTLLIVEDCDHLAQEVAAVIDALLAATQVCVIVCAEAPLFIAGEYVLPLAPLRFAARGAGGSAHAASDSSPDSSRIPAGNLASNHPHHVAADTPPSDACRFLLAQLDAHGTATTNDSMGTASHGTRARGLAAGSGSGGSGGIAGSVAGDANSAYVSAVSNAFSVVSGFSAARTASVLHATTTSSSPTARPALESICRALSGNPLALELAAIQIARAARGRTTLADAVADWDARWRRVMMQRAGSPDVALRPAALVPSVIAHAYYALDAGAQHLLCCTSLFAGPFDFADARAVSMRTDGAEGLAGDSALQTQVAALLDAGLLVERTRGAANGAANGAAATSALAASSTGSAVASHAGSSATSGDASPEPSLDTSPAAICSLRMPQAVRQFALGVLAYRFDYAWVAARHAQRVAERVSETVGHPSHPPARPASSPSSPSSPCPPTLADVRRAVDWSIEAGRFQIAAPLLQHAGPIWSAASLNDEWLMWIRRALAHDGSRQTLRVHDQMLLHLALAQAMQQTTPAPPPADTLAAWWRVYQLATTCAADDSRLYALSVLLLRTLQAGFSNDPPELLTHVRAQIAQECEGASPHHGFARLRGALMMLNGRHEEAIALLAPDDDNASAPPRHDPAEGNGPPDSRHPNYIAAVSHNALAISLWFTGARATSHPRLLRALQDARQPSDPVSRCVGAAMACVLFMLEENRPRAGQQARLLADIARSAGLHSWQNAARGFLLWIDAADETCDEARQLADLALRNLARGHATILDLLVFDRFAGLALSQVGGVALIRLFERMIANLLDSGRRWLLPEALRVNAVLCRHAGWADADVWALLERAAHEARQQRASMLSRRISATMEQIAPSR